MTETFKSLESLFSADCVPAVTNTADLLADWYKYEIVLMFLFGRKIILRFLLRMAQAVVLQAEILEKDVSAIDAIWLDTLKNQERFQFLYSTKLHELADAMKRRQHFPTGEVIAVEPKMFTETCDYKYNENFNQGLVLCLFTLIFCNLILICNPTIFRLKNLQAIQGDVSKLVEENSHMISRIERLVDIQKPK